MTMQNIEKIANVHLNKTWTVNGKNINLSALGVSFKWSNGKRVFGAAKCSYPRMIKLSKPLTVANLNDNPNQIIDTIKHEVAHLLDYFAFGNWGHGKTWKHCCIITGANPERCYSTKSINKPEYKYKMICPKCHNSIGRYRRPSKSYCCNNCYKKTGKFIRFEIL